eukprot:TRINITY_DN133_c0_g1_i1.p1 TRINITY_DN133_c0_g1~~TRINITY_DN133_c0_g1_i1.p1  ORF type:complete len:132 (-),score=27.59 TRINITY_DN133_c0_g1_i1:105-500(-)
MLPDQQWDTVVIHKRPTGQKATGEKAATVARQKGEAVTTERKFGAGTNKQHGLSDLRKIEMETEELKVKTVSHDLSQRIIQGRVAKGWKQQDLARAICEKIQVVQEYETGRAIPNQALIGKMERSLGCKLR